MKRLARVWLAGALVLSSTAARAAEGELKGPAARATNADSVVIARLARASKLSYAPKVVVTGDLKPEQSAMLGFAVPGTLTRVEVRRGQIVAAGQTLAVLDASSARAGIAQADAGIAAAEAGLSAAQAGLRLAEDGLRRLEAVKEAQGASEMQIVQARGQRDLAAAQVEGAKAQILVVKAQKEQGEVHVRNHVLRAPFAGLVTRVPDGAGMTVGPGMPYFAVESVQSLLLETSVTVEEAAAMREGTRLEVVSTSTQARTKDARVHSVLGSADPMTHRVSVQLLVPNRDGRFIAHAYARAEIPLGTARDALKVPAGALVQRGGAFTIWLADEDDRARSIRVRLKTQESDWAVIEPEDPGLVDGSRVVDLPPLDLADGVRIIASVSR